MSYRLWYIVAILIAAVCRPVFAHSSAMDLTLRDAILLAKSNNLSMKRLSIDAAINSKKVDSLRSYLLPKLSANLDSVALGGDAALLRGTAGLPSTYTVAGIQINQVVYDNASWGNYNAAKEQNIALDHSITASRMDIERQVIFAYLGLLQANTRVDIARQSLKMSKENLVQARHRVASGIARNSEVFRWEMQISNDTQSLNRALMSAKNAQLKLNSALNLPLSNVLSLHEVVDNTWIVSVGRFISHANLASSLVLLATQSLPELRAIDRSIRAQDLLLSSARRESFVPKVAVNVSSGTWFTTQDSWELSNKNKDFSESFSSATLSVSLPIDTSGSARSAIDSRSYELKKLQNSRDMLRQEIESRVLFTLNELHTAYENLQSSRSALSAAEQNMQLVLKSYRSGEVGVIDVVDAQVSAINMSLASVNIKHNLVMAYIELERSVGVVDMSDVVSSLTYLDSLVGHKV